MERPAQDPGRKSLPHLSSLEFSNQSIIQYVTVCVDKRRALLARPEIHELLLASWIKANHWLVGRYVIMPDHLHLFCAPAKFPHTPLKEWMKFWRADATRQWPHLSEKPIWQKDFFDRQLRSGESYSEKWMYVWENPVKAGLVKRAEDWAFCGEMNLLRWHEAARD
jgi:REP element-mobilizing transposase RayT